MVDYVAAFRADLDAVEPARPTMPDAAASLPLAAGKWSPIDEIQWSLTPIDRSNS
jgi:hypothetical protein